MPAPAPKRRALFVAACLSAGIALAHFAPPALPLAWIGGALLAATIAVLSRGGRAIAALACGAVLLGGGVYSIRVLSVPHDHVARRLTDTPALMTVEGVVVTAPAVYADRAGRFGRFVASQPTTVLQVEAARIEVEVGAPLEVSGRLIVRVAGEAKAMNIGDVVRIVGMARAVQGPTNPGEPDRRLWAAAQSVGGTIEVDAPGAAVVVREFAARDASVGMLARRGMESLRRGAREWLESDRMADASEREARALLRSLLLGTRERDLAGVDDAFSRLGLTHLLAISGFNLTLLAGTIFFLMRGLGDRPRLEALLAALVIGLYLLIIPVHGPVLRASAMVFAWLAGEAVGRRYDPLNTLGWAMVLVLLVQPLELFAAGFQLSFGVVAALLVLTRPVRERLFGERPQRDTIGTVRAAIEVMKDAAAASLIAWAIASPLVVYHVGVFSPLGALATVIVGPVTGVIMALGYLVLFIALAAPWLAESAAPTLTSAAEWLVLAVRTLDTLPGSALYMPSPGALWTLLATIAIVWWLRPGGPTGIEGYSGAARHARAGLTTLVSAWLAFTLLAPSTDGATRIRLDTLDVTDGSCHLLRIRHGWGEECLLYDCGSLRLTIGERAIPEALRALGVRRVPTVVLSHPNIDHYCGLLDVAPRLGVRSVLVGEAFTRAAGADPAGPVAYLLEELVRMNIEVRPVAEGDSLVTADPRVSFEVLSPPAGASWRNDNDASLVCLVRDEVSKSSLLFTGDIQSEAILSLRERHRDLRPAVLEAPHHGSFNPVALEFVNDLDPAIVVQSTGARRLDDPRWAGARRKRLWFATAGIGAVSIVVDEQGGMTTRTWRDR